MPEKPEVMTVANTLKKIIIGKEIKDVDILWNNIIATDLEKFKKNIKNKIIKYKNKR